MKTSLTVFVREVLFCTQLFGATTLTAKAAGTDTVPFKVVIASFVSGSATWSRIPHFASLLPC